MSILPTSSFYQQGDNVFTYDQLVDGVNQREIVVQNYYANDYFDFAINMVKAVVSNIDVDLIDYRNTTAPSVLKSVECGKHTHTVDTLLSAICDSKSSIGIYSSGSEGVPKLVYQTVHYLKQAVRVDDQYTGSVWGFTVNPSHLSGIQVCLQALCNKAALVDLYKLSRSEMLEQISSKDVTHLSATPTFYRMLSPYDFTLPKVQVVTLNGEKSTAKLIADVSAVFPKAKIKNIYGTTEAGSLMSSSSTTFEIPSRIRAKVQIQEGQLYLHGSLVSKSIESDEWYATGDLVEVVKAEPLTINFVSRKSRILNVGGQNVSPQEVEDVLIDHPLVKDARVYGRSHKLLGNLISAEVQPLGEVKEKELIDHCRQYLARYKVPRMIKLVDKIAIGNTGKKQG